jgi:hypothetical protein
LVAALDVLDAGRGLYTSSGTPHELLEGSLEFIEQNHFGGSSSTPEFFTFFVEVAEVD